MNEAFRKFAHQASEWLGSPWAFTAAVMVVAVWAVLGMIFGFSDSWQLVINTGTTIVTFLMVFLIQNTQNRDNRALHAKLDELIVNTAAADNAVVESETMSEEELRALEDHFHEMAHSVHRRLTGDEADLDEHVRAETAPVNRDGEDKTDAAEGQSRSYHRIA